MMICDRLAVGRSVPPPPTSLAMLSPELRRDVPPPPPPPLVLPVTPAPAAYDGTPASAKLAVRARSDKRRPDDAAEATEARSCDGGGTSGTGDSTDVAGDGWRW